KAQDKANEAAKQLDPQAKNMQPMDGMQQKNGMQPDLAELQKQVADKAGQLQQKDAQKDAADAAKALERGDLQSAVQKQPAAREKLNQAAKSQPMPGEKGMGEPMMGEKGMGEKGMGEKGMGEGTPMNAQTPGELAKNQQQLLDATKALQQSKEANNAAQAAL